MPQQSDRHRIFRKTIFRVHTWLGLHVCIALGIIFFTGTLLMYSAELTNLSQPSLWTTAASRTAEPLSVGRIYDSALTARPGRQIATIGSQPRAWFGRPVYLAGKGAPLVAHVNGYTGEILGLQSRGKLSLRNLVRKLHDSLLVPFHVVHVLVNTLSFVVLTLVVTGLLTYRRFWRGFFLRVPRDASQLVRASTHHRRFAVWVAPFLIASTLASAVFFLNAIGFKARLTPDPVVVDARSSALPAGFNGEALDALVLACQNEVPGFIETGVKFPNNGKQFVRINGYDSEVGGIFGSAFCHADPDAGTVVGIVRASDGNWMTQIKALAVAVHFGTFAGWFSIGFWTLFGVCSTYVAITGARVFAARAIVKAGGAEGSLAQRGTLSLVVQGLGVFKWLYLLWILGVLALLLRDLV